MIVHSPHQSRERILAFGGYGAGKTWNYFDIARHTPDGVRFWVIDTDMTTLPFLESEEFGGLESRFEVFEPFTWPEYMDAIKRIRGEAGRDDWIVVDMMHKPWEEVQNHFAEEVYGTDLGDYWTSYLKALQEKDGRGSKSAFDGTTDWQAIKKMYAQFTGNLLRVKGHLYLAAPEKKVNEQFDGDVYSDGGMKPDCEKSTGHMTRTVLRMKRQRVTTVKDRQRGEIQGAKVNSFALDYLVAKGGWQVGGG